MTDMVVRLKGNVSSKQALKIVGCYSSFNKSNRNCGAPIEGRIFNEIHEIDEIREIQDE
jgi:hypothetical protein